jgi:hypothetical protein
MHIVAIEELCKIIIFSARRCVVSVKGSLRCSRRCGRPPKNCERLLRLSQRQGRSSFAQDDHVTSGPLQQCEYVYDLV